MAEKEPVSVLFSELDQHPATLAWKQAGLNGTQTPQVIEVLQKQRKSEIYRLLKSIGSGESIIAKRCVTKTGKFERVIYEDILPLIPVSQLHYYGSFQEDDSYMWLFLGDAGKFSFSPTDESHHILAAHWLGGVHRFAPHTPAAELLPERGPSHYFELMQKAREKIGKILASPTLSPAHNEVLKRVLTQMDMLESNWQDLLKYCEGIPATLAHGDFRPKNVHVKQSPTGEVLYTMDWEMAGWGNPVVDLAPSRGFSSEPQVDMPIYISMMQEIWPGLDISTVRYFVQMGCIFRRMAAIYWSSLEMSFHWLDGPIRDMDIFHKELSHAMAIVFGREFVND
jgi:phosphotransferase family enzyme